MHTTPEEKAARLQTQHQGKAKARAAQETNATHAQKASETPEEKAARLQTQRQGKAKARAAQETNATRFDAELQLDNVYIITNALVSSHDDFGRKFDPHPDFGLRLFSDTIVLWVDDDLPIPEINVSGDIAAMPTIPELQVIEDVGMLAIGHSLEPSADDKSFATLVDDSAGGSRATIRLTLYGKHARSATQDWVGQSLLLQRFKVNDGAISASAHTCISIAASLPEAKRLLHWYSTQ
ncbi:hypothetical protein SPRG_01847 [Saprolegnia parasitica CBS 223.65]|uniref:Uncharacterized protein n=1 Tax=Saprolegnia parasitica (strain CBS 223.65) TaxID=695850 RepID=A0A067D2P3_SAPPC|nr:hypothetical protein SPRG_01847 [Saprolegnia parasitica CBS 223.65]KDO33031.1 hypothetical protein SPRG_01847 [Saprolegnia parasitica CBS 223.65]|eukprot:XP_012195803.1 hypothetical protein SPRG_01847 [Saprolegnia parasitica CBS 223.65]